MDLKASTDRNDENPAVSLLKRILEDARSHGATTIEIEPRAGDVTRVRYEVDGQLREAGVFPRVVYPALAGRVKVMAGMDVADCQNSQSGVIRLSNLWTDIDYVMTTLPAEHGEALRLRARPHTRTQPNPE